MRILKLSAVFAITVSAALMSSTAWADNASPKRLHLMADGRLRDAKLEPGSREAAMPR